MLLRKCARTGGFRGLLLGLLCIIGYFVVATTIAWGTYGNFETTYDKDMWRICFILGLTGTGAWIVVVDGICVGIRALFTSEKFLVFLVGCVLFALGTLFLTAAFSYLMVGFGSLHASAADVFNFMIEYFPEAYVVPAIMTWVMSRPK